MENDAVFWLVFAAVGMVITGIHVRNNVRLEVNEIDPWAAVGYVVTAGAALLGFYHLFQTM